MEAFIEEILLDETNVCDNHVLNSLNAAVIRWRLGNMFPETVLKWL